MNKIKPLIVLVTLLTQGFASASNSLGQVNIKLSGTIVDFTCVAEVGDSVKSVPLGRWSTKQLSTTGSRTPAVPFSLKLEGCPPGAASLTFTGKANAQDSELLALNEASHASNVAIEIRNQDKTRLPLQQASQDVKVDAQGHAVLQFYANYIATANDPQPGRADADATFVINYY
ncbi:fimbria assembly protein [Leclercia sp. UBA7405]|uniref:fimbria assembly protein n=1 Tax=Leclercia sp. UBA7405 TaxID=1946743 RepID=UPI00301A1FC2